MMDKAEESFLEVPNDVKEDVSNAIKWAENTLMRLEGEGHLFNLIWSEDGIECSFAKPCWPGDHCGRPMRTGSEAIVMAVCEYINGF